MKLRDLLVLALFFALVVPVNAVNIIQSEELRLTPSNPSQTITFSLDDIPDNLRKKNGNIKNGSVKLKFKFINKADKKRFTLSPKKGTLKIKVRDGEIQPASITVTSKDISELTTNENIDFTVKASKKRRKKAGIEENLTDDVALVVESLTITGQVQVPPNNVSQFTGSGSSSLVTQNALGLSPTPEVQIEVRNLELSSVPPQLILSATANSQGFFELELPPGLDIGPQTVCQAVGNNPSDPNNILRAPLSSENILIDPTSEFISRLLYGVEPDLPPQVGLEDVSNEEVKAFEGTIRALEVEAQDDLIQTFVKLTTDAGLVGESIVNSIREPATSNSGNQSPETFTGFNFRYVRDADKVGIDVNPPIIGLTSSGLIEDLIVNFGQSQNSIFPITGTRNSIIGVGGARELNGPNPPVASVILDDQADRVKLPASGVKKDDCLTLFAPPIDIIELGPAGLNPGLNVNGFVFDQDEGEFVIVDPSSDQDGKIVLGTKNPRNGKGGPGPVLNPTNRKFQSLDGEVVRNTDDTVMYTIDLDGPPRGTAAILFSLLNLPQISLPYSYIGLDIGISPLNAITYNSTFGTCTLDQSFKFDCTGTDSGLIVSTSGSGLSASSTKTSGTSSSTLSTNSNGGLKSTPTQSGLGAGGANATKNGSASKNGHEMILTGTVQRDDSTNFATYGFHFVRNPKPTTPLILNPLDFKVFGSMFIFNDTVTFPSSFSTDIGTANIFSNFRFTGTSVTRSDERRENASTTNPNSVSNTSTSLISRSTTQKSNATTSLSEAEDGGISFNFDDEFYECYFANDMDLFACRVTSLSGFDLNIADTTNSGDSNKVRKVGIVYGGVNQPTQD